MNKNESVGNLVTLIVTIGYLCLAFGIAGVLLKLEVIIKVSLIFFVVLTVGTIALVTIWETIDKIERLREKKKRRTRIEVAKDIFDALARENGEEK